MTSRVTGVAPWIAFVAIAFAFVTGNAYVVSVGILICIWAMLAVGLNFLMGYTGMIHLGLGAFYGFGAYLTAIATLNWNWPSWSMLIVCPLGAFVLGGLIGPALLRTKGLHFSVATLGLGMIVSDVLYNWTPVTKGPLGIAGIERPPGFALGGFTFDPTNDQHFLVMMFVMLALCVGLATLFHRSGMARVLVAGRDDDLLAASLGFRVLPYRVFAFAASSAMAGFVGVFYAWYIRYISPPSFTFFALSFQVFVLVAVGGSGSVWGPIVGALVLTGLPELMHVEGHIKIILYGLVLLAVIALLPRGIVPSAADGVRWLRERLTTKPPSAVAPAKEPVTAGDR